MRSARAIINEASPGKLPDALRLARAGDMLASVPRFIRGTVVNDVLVLPENAKAAAVLRCFVAAGTVNGRFTFVEDDTPATTQCSLNPAGDVVFLAGDAVTEAEVLYVPVEGQVFEDLIVVDAGGTEQGSFLQGRLGAQLLSVEALEGTAPGDMALDELRGATPAAGSAALMLDGTGVEFAAADAITLARVRYVAQPGAGTQPALGEALNAEDKAF